jgi:hypothetical protein
MMWIRVLLLSIMALSQSVPPIVMAAPTTEPDTVQVYLSHNPESASDFTAVFPLPRTVPGGAGIIEQTLAALIAGPTPSEQAAGYFSDFRAIQTGTVSFCKGLDFTLRVVSGTATVNLCRQTSSAGIGQDARAQSEVEATLMQFPGIARVVVLDSAGHCLFDESGLDLCLGP